MSSPETFSQQKQAVEISMARLQHIFSIPVSPESTLRQIEQHLSQNLQDFLQAHLVTTPSPLDQIEQRFTHSHIPEQPQMVSEHAQHLLEKVLPYSVHTASPRFIGHMTSALPYFLLPLSQIMIALNQNVVKIETSKAFTPLERQVLAMLHRLIYQQADAFYDRWIHDPRVALGIFCSGGTIANISALWVARNRALGPQADFAGVQQAGLWAAMRYYGYQGLAVLVSERGHYSLKKAADLLGIGSECVIAVKTDASHRLCVHDLKAQLAALQAQSIRPIAIVGVAGTTETGHIDPLAEIAAVAKQAGCHFHVDAAWGGATLMSEQYRSLLQGIELADSVTIDAHKQLYIPMGAGMVFFKDPHAVQDIAHHAQYILRHGSKDLGCHSLEGSRAGMAMLLYSSLHIVGRPGYQLLIDQSIDKAHYFAQLIDQHPAFELVSAPELCLLTYRYVPAQLQAQWAQSATVPALAQQQQLDRLTQSIQTRQRDQGQSFVSRTRFYCQRHQTELTVFRVVLANPLTSKQMLVEILEEQLQLAESDPLAAQLLASVNLQPAQHM